MCGITGFILRDPAMCEAALVATVKQMALSLEQSWSGRLRRVGGRFRRALLLSGSAASRLSI